jgi:Lrp/AsnC family leucine-responsive transcriptional regulator
MTASLDSKDLQILRIIQQNCRTTAREISERINLPVTTVFARMKRFEKLGIVRGYHAFLEATKLNAGTTAFVLASFASKGEEKVLSQRNVAKEIAGLTGVQEVHIISGEWDILIKVKAKDVEYVGKFVVDKLRLVKGIERTLTCFVFETEKESTAIPL